VKITIVGTGYVGLVSGVCLADVGNTPDVIYRTASGGGARIADKFKERKEPQGVVETEAAPIRCGLTGDHLKLNPLLS